MSKSTECRLEWECERCGFPIADGAGAVRIDLAEVRDAEAAGEPVMTSWDDIIQQDYFYPAQWMARHIACDDIDGPFYAIDVERIRTPEQMLWWTAHLMEKRWLTFTNWRGIIRHRGVSA